MNRRRVQSVSIERVRADRIVIIIRIRATAVAYAEPSRKQYYHVDMTILNADDIGFRMFC